MLIKNYKVMANLRFMYEFMSVKYLWMWMFNRLVIFLYCKF